MDNRRIAMELLIAARELVAVSPDVVLDEMKSIEVAWAEGHDSGIPSLKGKKFSSVRALERELNRFTPPDIGYDKVGIVINLKDGSKLTGFRYDHGEKDPALTRQLEWYLKNRVTLTGSERDAASGLVAKEKRVTRATIKAVLRKMGLKPDQYELGRDVTFWPENFGDNWHEGDEIAEKYAHEFSKIMGGLTIRSNGSKYWVRWKGETPDMGDWNDPGSRWHY
jgi:hypothetical protein